MRSPGLLRVIPIAVAIVLLMVGPTVILPRLAGSRLVSLARSRGLNATWTRLGGQFPASVRFDGLVLSSVQGDTIVRARSASLNLTPISVLLMRPRIARVGLEHVTLQLPRRSGVDPDTLDPEPATRRDRGHDPQRAERVRQTAESVVRLLLTPARQLPRLALRDVTLRTAAEDEGPWSEVRLERLDLRHVAGKALLGAAGMVHSEHPLPFEASLEYARDDRLRGVLRVDVPGRQRGESSELEVALDGAVTQDRRAGRVTVHDTTRVLVGEMPLRVGASFDRKGPRVRLGLAANGITEKSFEASLPRGVLGELAEVGVDGSWDYRLDFDLDFGRPDSVAFEADVIPHRLALDPGRTRLRLLGLDQPFTAAIRLPRDRQAVRSLSAANPYYRSLGAISPALIYAVVTNEDGGFFRHRGFNTEAMREAIAENIKAGAFRRGAGTITMQLARNLYLGHERSLSRKFREVVLAWVLENLTGVSKDRLLEIYLNVIEWGPGIHGAAEATRFFFDRDPAEISVDEALFLSAIVPAPAKWRYRFDAAGRLRPFAQAQMHFIGRAMVAKGWLDLAALPPTEGLQVELRGAARKILFPESARDVDSLGAFQTPSGGRAVDRPRRGE